MRQAPLKAMILSCAGLRLTGDEIAFFARERPCGLILFARNCDSPVQVADLVGQFHDAVGSDEALVLVDQEGGRVQRLAMPHWRQLPSAARVAALPHAAQAARDIARLIAADLAPLGITVNCAPVLDMPADDADPIISDRAYGQSPLAVSILGRAVCDGLMDGGVLPVIKHMPGHGRARCDSHLALPVIDTPFATLERTDFRPFAALRDMPLAMTAHVVLTAVDRDAPVSASPRAIDTVIRGAIRYDGLLMCDDIGMKALTGTMGARATACLSAGCDVVLHCSGDLAEMVAVAAVVPALAHHAERRFQAARARLAGPRAFDVAAAEGYLGAALASSA